MPSKKTVSNVDSGSPTHGEPVYLAVGYLRRAHGVHGEMVMEVLTDFPERLKPKTRVYVGRQNQPMTITSVRIHGEGLLVKFGELNEPEAARRYRNQLVSVTAADRPRLPKGQFYHHQLIGYEVLDEQKELIGTLHEIMQTGANDVYVVTRPDDSELLLPVIPSVVQEIDSDRRLIHIRLIPGLLDEYED
ncbi:MAG TPA: ribosome maturation factor RimM [Anaerolineales bacterium]|nr:ribosome maturation factor RimM [Anaerolineales bacterium]